MWKFVRNYLLNTFTFRKIPYSAQIELTLRCNAKCKFCAIPGMPNSLKKKEMTTEQIKSIIDQIAKLGVLSLTFTGGEPTLRGDLPELIYHTGVVHNFITGLASNGYNLPKLLDNNKLNGLNYILISLDFPIAELHDHMRGIKVFDNVIKSIKLAAKRDIKIIISTNVMKENIRYLPELCDLAKNLDCCIELFPCEDIIRIYNGQKYKVGNMDSIIPNLHLWAKIVRNLQKKYKNLLTDRFSIKTIESGGFGGTPKYQKAVRCHVAEAYLFVRHDGYIDYPCKIHPIKRYNALEKPIYSIYNSKEVKEIMKKHDGYEFCNGCRLGCAIASSLTTHRATIYEKYIKNFFKGNLK
ncbi:MAG: radical SAM protein [Candidatus Lokiarchaeota archaeon]|nr:radical SAM protein [Candidatus Lokiarchaeota archaeon]